MKTGSYKPSRLLRWDQVPSFPKRFNIPMYGPLNITNVEKFKKQQREYFKKHFSDHGPYQPIDNFHIITLLGEGSFGKVYLVKYKKNNKLFAMKVLGKKFLLENSYITLVLNEKRTLQGLQFPFCVYLECLSHDKSNLYFCLPFVSGGVLYTTLQKHKKFNEDVTQFYAGQVVIALEFLHYCNLVHRDLKPENLLIDHTGYIKVTDFGFTKEVKSRLYTFCGTPEYIAPEIILGIGHSKAVDYWSLGVLIFEMVKGKTPFYSVDEMITFKKIISAKYDMPVKFSKHLQDLIKKLLQKDVTHRFGNLNNGVEDIKKHHWFENTNWLRLLNKSTTPPYIPAETDDMKTYYPHIKSTVIDSNTTDKDYEKFFKDF